MTVDGRQSGFSEGVNLVELADLMLSLAQGMQSILMAVARHRW
jgi:hypothetical protein